MAERGAFSVHRAIPFYHAAQLRMLVGPVRAPQARPERTARAGGEGVEPPISAKIRIPVVVFVCGLARSEPQPLDSSFAKQPAGVEAG